MATVWTDQGQTHAVACLNPSTRGAQVTTYYGAQGSGTTAPAVTQTALVTENAEARVACTVNTVTTQSTSDSIQYVWTVTYATARTVNEFGVFTASSAGNMLLRGVLSGTVSVNNGDSIQFTVTVQNQNGASSGS